MSHCCAGVPEREAMSEVFKKHNSHIQRPEADRPSEGERWPVQWRALPVSVRQPCSCQGSQGRATQAGCLALPGARARARSGDLPDSKVRFCAWTPEEQRGADSHIPPSPG